MSIRVRIGVMIVMAMGLALLVPAARAQQAPLKIGVFDSQRISEETAEGKRVQAHLSDLQAAKRREIESKQQEVDDLQQRLNQQGLSLSASTRAALEMDIQRKALALNNAKDLANREFQLDVSAAEQEFNDKLRTVVQQFGRDEGFSILLEGTTVAWWSNSVDVTTALVDMFDRLYPPTETAEKPE